MIILVILFILIILCIIGSIKIFIDDLKYVSKVTTENQLAKEQIHNIEYQSKSLMRMKFCHIIRKKY